MRTIKKEICLEEITSRIPSLLPYIDFDPYGDSALYNGTNDGTLGILHKATDGLEGSYGHIMGSFKMPSNVELYSEAVMYYPRSYIRILWESNETNELKTDEEYQSLSDDVKSKYFKRVINTFDYNDLSLYGKDCYKSFVYKKYNSENDYVSYNFYNNLDENSCDKFDYRPFLYLNEQKSTTEITEDYIEIEVRNNSEENDVLTVIISNNGGWWKNEVEIDGNIVNVYYELIDRQSFLKKTKLSKIDFKVKECSDGNNSIELPIINGEELNQNNIPFTVGNKTYKPLFFLTRRNDGSLLLNYEDNVDCVSDVLNYEFYGVSLKRQLIKPNESYSYRTMMDIYYASNKRKVKENYVKLLIGVDGNNNIYDDYRFVNKENKNDMITYIDYYNLEDNKQTFISFIDDAIGKYYTKDVVRQFNEAHENTILQDNVVYTLNSDNDLTYEEIINSGFYEIEDVYFCDQYVKTQNNMSDTYNTPYLYISEVNSGFITKDIFNSLPLYSTNAYRAVKYNLDRLPTIESEITREIYYKLPFYGKSAYRPNMYFNGEIITAEEYFNKSDEEKKQYMPYKYININDSRDIISEDTYNNAYTRNDKKGNYKVYQYITSGYSTLTYQEYINDDKPEGWTVMTYVNLTKSDDVIDQEVFDNLPEYGMMEYTAVEWENTINTTEPNITDFNTYYNLSGNGQTDYVQYRYIPSNENDMTLISRKNYLSLPNNEEYLPYKYIPKNNVQRIDELQYNALPKYGAKDYVVYEYYASIDTSLENEEARYETFIITADEYNNDEYWTGGEAVGEKYQYSIYSYKPIGADESYVIQFNDYDNIPYFGQIDYKRVKNNTLFIQVNGYWYEHDPNGNKIFQDVTYFYWHLEHGDSQDYGAAEEIYTLSSQPIVGNLIYEWMPVDTDSAVYEMAENGFSITEIRGLSSTVINLNKEIYISKKNGEVISEKEWNNLTEDQQQLYESSTKSKKCKTSLVPDVIYLGQINSMLIQLKNMKKNHELYVGNKLLMEQGINCEYSKYLRMGGDDMILLLEWLRARAENIAENFMENAILDNFITIPVTLTLTLQDSGYLTPAMNYKTGGMIVYKGEPFTYVDSNGVAGTYVYKGSGINKELVLDRQEQWLNNNNIINIRQDILYNNSIYTNKKDYGVVYKNSEFPSDPISLEGVIDSKLQTLRTRKTYTNYLEQPETPPSGEDWLFYYRKGSVFDVSMTSDEDGNILEIPGTENEQDKKRNPNLLLYGNVLTDIKPDNETCTIEFTYYINAHLQIKEIREYTESRRMTEAEYEYFYENYIKNKVIDKDNIIDNRKYVDKNNAENVISGETYDNLSTDAQSNYIWEQTDDTIVIKYKERKYVIDKEGKYGKHHGIKHTDKYQYERYGTLYDLAQNYDPNNKDNIFTKYIESEQRDFEKYPFVASPNNTASKIVNNQIISIPYISSEFNFEYDIKENSYDLLFNNVYKEDLLNGVHYKPTIKNDAFVIRGTNAAFERHIRLGEVKTLEDFENYHNGSFFNIQNNF